MDELKAKMLHLAPYSAAMAKATSWQDITRAYGKDLDMNNLYAKHGCKLLRAVRQAGKLKGIYQQAFPEATTYWNKRFGISCSASSTTAQEPSVETQETTQLSEASGSQFPVQNTFIHFAEPKVRSPRARSEERANAWSSQAPSDKKARWNSAEL